MSAGTAGTAVASPPGIVGASLALAGRNVTRILRNSGSMVSATVIPGIFLVALYIVFSTAMETNGIDYAQYLVPAATLQAVLFTAGGSAMAIGVDKTTGVNDRLRASPVPTAAPVMGRLLADLVRATASVAVVTVIGVLLGFRWQGGPGEAVIYLVTAVGTAVAVSLIYDGITLVASTPESAASLLQALSMPLIMLSTSYVPSDALPDGAAGIIGASPLSVLTDLLRRASTGDVTVAATAGAAAWILGLTVFGAVLSARAFRRQS